MISEHVLSEQEQIETLEKLALQRGKILLRGVRECWFRDQSRLEKIVDTYTPECEGVLSLWWENTSACLVCKKHESAVTNTSYIKAASMDEAQAVADMIAKFDQEPAFCDLENLRELHQEAKTAFLKAGQEVESCKIALKKAEADYAEAKSKFETKRKELQDLLNKWAKL